VRRDLELMEVDWNPELSQESQGFINFALHIILVIGVMVLGLTIFFWPSSENGPISILNLPLNALTLQAMRYGFLGGFLLSIQTIYRRYTTFDLHPSVYMYCALLLLGGLVLNFVLIEALIAVTTTSSDLSNNPAFVVTDVPSADNVGPESTVEPGAPENEQSSPSIQSQSPNPVGIPNWGIGLISIMSFALGFFPILALQWLTSVAHGAFRRQERRSDALGLDLIDGITQQHEIRLRDHGIDNVQNLASVDIPILILSTTFSAQEIIDWVDQAILYLYLDATDIQSLHLAKIRTISDFRDVWRDVYLDPTTATRLTTTEREQWNNGCTT
jgi:hypothetical protein